MAKPQVNEKARRARAIWAYSMRDQAGLASDAGIHRDRLRAILARTNPAEPTTDELLALTQAVDGIPPGFAILGFAGEADDGAEVWSAIARMSDRLTVAESQIEEARLALFAAGLEAHLQSESDGRPGRDVQAGPRR